MCLSGVSTISDYIKGSNSQKNLPKWAEVGISRPNQGSYRNLTVVFQTFPGQNYTFFQTFQGILFIFMWTKTLQNWLLNAEISYIIILLFSIPNITQFFKLWTSDALCYYELTVRKLTNARVINRVIGMHFSDQHYSFQDFFPTFPYLWSFSRLFKALKISTLNSRTFHTFPGSVRTLCILVTNEDIGVKFHNYREHYRRNAKLGQRGSWSGHVTYFLNFGTPFMISRMDQVRNFKLGTNIDHPKSLTKKCKIRSKGVGKGSSDLLLKFCDPLHIPGTGEARNFKFGMHIDEGH